MEKSVKSVYFKYIIANFAKEFFKAQIEELDINNEYIKKSEVQDFDPAEIKAFKESEVYQCKMQMVESELKIWREEHREYYRMQLSLESSSVYSKYCENVKLYDLIDLAEYLDPIIKLNIAIQGYKAANEILKSISNEDLTPYCTELKPMLNYEYKPEYNKINNQLKTKYEVPSDEEIKSTLSIKTIIKKRLSLNREKSTDSTTIDEFYSLFNKNYVNGNR